jgi:hypothetical protein
MKMQGTQDPHSTDKGLLYAANLNSQQSTNRPKTKILEKLLKSEEICFKKTGSKFIPIKLTESRNLRSPYMHGHCRKEKSGPKKADVQLYKRWNY